jgi:Heavy metal associated domain 2
MELTVCHSIPGRIRLRVPALCHRPLLAETALSWLRKQEGTKSARINYDCANLIIEYDPLLAKVLQGFVDNLAILASKIWRPSLAYRTGHFSQAW